MDEDDAVRSIHEERLGLFFAFCVPAGGIPNVTQSNVPEQSAHVAGAKRLTHLTLRLD